MNYSIVSKGDAFSDQVVQTLYSKLTAIQMVIDDESPDLVISVGGDGTMLKAVHKYLKQIEKVVFVGVHTGKLGFYTDYIYDEVDILVEKIKENVYTDVAFPLLKAHVCKADDCLTFYALNEIALLNPYHTQHVEVLINDEYFESFQGTGIIISTPSGSSAYNKSVGGALLHPSIPAFQMTEIGSINNNVYRTISSPVIFPKEHSVTIKAIDFNEVTLTIDHMHQNLRGYESIIFTLSDRMVRIRQYKENDFWKRVQKSFL